MMRYGKKSYNENGNHANYDLKRSWKNLEVEESNADTQLKRTHLKRVSTRDLNKVTK